MGRRGPITMAGCFAVAAALFGGQASGGDDAGDLGAYAAGRTTVTVTRPDSQTFTALLYYPAAAPGQDTPFDGSGAPYPGVSFGHGFVTRPTAYDSTLRHLATHGYLVIATESYTGLFPDHSKYADDLLYCLNWLELESADPGSALYGAVDIGAFGLSGHSMGGGASILATARDSRVRALANLAAAETNPSAIEAMGAVRVPAALLSGSEDGITPPNQHQVPMYQAGAVPKQLVTLLGGYHCGFLDSSILFCDSGSLARGEQLLLTRRLLVEFFDLYLRDDQTRWGTVWGPGAGGDPRVEMTLECGIALDPASSSLAVRAGGIGVRDFVVTNTGPLETGYGLLIEDSPWEALADPDHTAALAPGASAGFDARLAPPVDAAGEEADVLVTARSALDGGTRGFATLSVIVRCPSDWNLDGLINSLDVLAYLNVWAGSATEADVNGDGAVNTLDVLQFLNWYGAGC